MRDQAGQSISRGDFVVYGARWGNSGHIKLGIVTDTDRGSIITGDFNCVYDPEKKEYTDKSEFQCSGVPGHGVSGFKLLKLPSYVYQNAYNILYEKAKKYL